MKKFLSIFLAAVVFLSLSLTVFADTASSQDETAKRTFSTVSTIQSPQNVPGTNTAGIIMWSVTLGILSVLIIYMIFNYIKIKRIEKSNLENQMIKPKIIISTTYKKQD